MKIAEWTRAIRETGLDGDVPRPLPNSCGIHPEQLALFLSSISESLQDGVVAVDRDGKIMLFNSGAERILGKRELAPRSVIYGNYFRYFREDEVTPVPRNELPLSRALAGEVFHRLPLFVKKPGESAGVHISVSGGPVRDGSSRILGAVVSFIDMTGFLEAKAKLAEQQHMLAYTSRMSAVGELAGALAHEINTPLATLSLIFEGLKKQLMLRSATLPAKTFDHLEMVEGLTDRIARIVRSLRTVCRPGNNDLFMATPIRRILRDTKELCVERLRILGISFSIIGEAGGEAGGEAEGDLGTEVEIDCHPMQIVQVLLNLINNSCDAIKGLDTRWIVLEIRRNDDALEFRITDSGPGIPPEVAPQLFSPLFSTKEDSRGSGIGLNISKRIIESHGGSIDLNSKHEHTQFFFLLPIQKKSRAAA